MKIEHIAILTSDLERSKKFYQKFFDVKCGNKYENSKKGFSSYFLSFEDGARIEIMRQNNLISDIIKSNSSCHSHFAISVGSKEKVENLTRQIKNDGYNVISEPRTTGDGYYESVILDPDGNYIEITI